MTANLSIGSTTSEDRRVVVAAPVLPAVVAAREDHAGAAGVVAAVVGPGIAVVEPFVAGACARRPAAWPREDSCQDHRNLHAGASPRRP